MMKDNFLLEKLSGYSDGFTFLIGNGINQYLHQAFSWNTLLSQLIKEGDLQLPESVIKVLKGRESKTFLTFPEIYSLIEGKKRAGQISGMSLKKTIASYFEKNILHCALLEYAKRTGKDIITTNYDYTIEDSIGIGHSPRKFNAQISEKSLYHYLYECFTKEDSARVWHIHGHCGKPGSIRISLEDYINTWNYIKTRLFSKDGEYFNPGDGNVWLGYSGCLGPFFTKPLVIVGCGLQSEEVLLRELLLFKFRAGNRAVDNSPIKNGGLYLSGGNSVNEDKKAFFEAIGFEFIHFEKYDELYDNPAWEQMGR